SDGTRTRDLRPVTPEVAGSSPVAPVYELRANRSLSSRVVVAADTKTASWKRFWKRWPSEVRVRPASRLVKPSSREGQLGSARPAPSYPSARMSGVSAAPLAQRRSLPFQTLFHNRGAADVIRDRASEVEWPGRAYERPDVKRRVPRATRRFTAKRANSSWRSCSPTSFLRKRRA